jgi:hypothetical protein
MARRTLNSVWIPELRGASRSKSHSFEKFILAILNSTKSSRIERCEKDVIAQERSGGDGYLFCDCV